jgi:hypothetical protein
MDYELAYLWLQVTARTNFGTQPSGPSLLQHGTLPPLVCVESQGRHIWQAPSIQSHQQKSQNPDKLELVEKVRDWEPMTTGGTATLIVTNSNERISEQSNECNPLSGQQSRWLHSLGHPSGSPPYPLLCHHNTDRFG